jgi:hypothetical protein
MVDVIGFGDIPLAGVVVDLGEREPPPRIEPHLRGIAGVGFSGPEVGEAAEPLVGEVVVAVDVGDAPRGGTGFGDEEATVAVGGDVGQRQEVRRLVRPLLAAALAAERLLEIAVGGEALDPVAGRALRHEEVARLRIDIEPPGGRQIRIDDRIGRAALRHLNDFPLSDGEDALLGPDGDAQRRRHLDVGRDGGVLFAEPAHRVLLPVGDDERVAVRGDVRAPDFAIDVTTVAVADVVLCAVRN